jgi:hypothetical protein
MKLSFKKMENISNNLLKNYSLIFSGNWYRFMIEIMTNIIPVKVFVFGKILFQNSIAIIEN